MSSCSADRISNLPCDVINLILEHLPLRDVVRTSILSKGWRYKWVTIPSLSFNRDLEEMLSEDYNLESIIDWILVCHKGGIVKFSLVDCGIGNLPAINQWLSFLLDHRIEDLVISFSWPSGYPMMPIHLFAFDNLTNLDLGSCVVKLPPTFRGFRRLARLFLLDVRIESGDLEMWLSKCPMLEYLIVDDYHGYLCLEIDAPNLIFFHFMGGLKSICIKNSNLEEISLCRVKVDVKYYKNFELPDSRGSESNLFRFLGHTLSLKKLHLDCSTMRYMARRGLPRKLPNDLEHLTLLELSSSYFGIMSFVTCALCLIRSSPNLQSLILSGCEDQWHAFTAEEHEVVDYMKEEQQKCYVPHRRLKYVKICSITSREHELELLKFLLWVATALEKLEIESIVCHCDEGTQYAVEHCTCHEKSGIQTSMLKELASFYRASSRAAVILDGEPVFD